MCNYLRFNRGQHIIFLEPYLFEYKHDLTHTTHTPHTLVHKLDLTTHIKPRC
jgi:hypothetical protein